MPKSMINMEGEHEIDEEVEEEIFELNVLDQAKEVRMRKLKNGVLVDSGAAVTVANGEKEFTQFPLQPSEGSKKGQKYAGPGAELIPNRGQRDVCLRLGSEQGRKAGIRFHDAGVRRPILSVGETTDMPADNTAVLDRIESVVIPC